MELKYEFLYNQNNKTALDKLFATDFDGKTAYNIRRIHYHCERNFKILQKEFQNITKKHSKLDDKGELFEPNGPGSFELIKEKVPEYQKEITELLNKTFKLDKCAKVHISKITTSDNLKLSSHDLGSLEPLIDGFDLEELGPSH